MNAARVLCVDDEVNVLKALRRLLMDENYELFTVSSGQDGLQLLEAGEPFQIVISDYRMPEMNGVDFLAQVCERWPDTIRIVLSGYADTAAIVDAINQGQIYKFIAKPWNDDELKVTINNAIELWRLNSENKRLNEELHAANEELQTINENLEKLVEERTNELQFQIEALVYSQTLLNRLPLAVMGFDNTGLIVYSNEAALRLVKTLSKSDAFLGENRNHSLPRELNELLDRLASEQNVRADLSVAGVGIWALGHSLVSPGGPKGQILALVTKS